MLAISVLVAILNHLVLSTLRAKEAEPLNAERAKYWISQGAQPTATAIQILEKIGVETGNSIAKREKAYKARSCSQSLSPLSLSNGLVLGLAVI